MNPAQSIYARAKDAKRADQRRALYVKAHTTEMLRVAVLSRRATEAAFAERKAQREESRRSDR